MNPRVRTRRLRIMRLLVSKRAATTRELMNEFAATDARLIPDDMEALAAGHFVTPCEVVDDVLWLPTALGERVSTE